MKSISRGKRILIIIVITIFTCQMSSLLSMDTASASTNTPVYFSDGKTVIGYLNESGEILYKLAQNPDYNINYLNYLLGDNVQKTVILPSGSTIPLRYSIKLGSNKVLIARGVKINITTAERGAISSTKPISNIKIYGGTWRNIIDKEGCVRTMFRFAHSSNILVDGCDIQANVNAHSLEIIACKYVTVKNSKICATGTYSSTRYEDPIQIDIATPHTAPRIMTEFGADYVKGQTCSNIYIINNYIKGARGLGTSFAAADTQYINRFHRNIVIQDNVIVGRTGEGVSLFNTISATITGNEIYSFSGQLSTSYSIGLHVSMFGNISSASSADQSIVIKSNLIKGGRQALQVYSKTSSKYGRVYIKYNNLYCKNGASVALKAPKTSMSYLYVYGNKYYNWI